MSMLPFVNLSDLPKIVNNFIDKISHAAGIWWEPKQKVRLAEAEAKADLIRAVGEIKVEAVKELAERAGKRIVYEELRKQSNMESIIDKAILAINEEAKPQDLQDDWIANFFDKCRLVSDEQMQVLWARILSGEANAPGRFSKKTVNLVANLDKSDAEAFATLCGFAIKILQGHPLPLIYDTRHSIYTANGISYFGLSNLESVGLIRFDNTGRFVQTTVLLMPPDTAGRITERAMHEVPASYYGQTIMLELPQKEDPALRVGTVMLTEPGQQLARVCDAHAVAGFVDYLKEKWKSFGYNIKP